MSGNRERQREQRRQRKLRAAERQAEMAARSEARNEQARETLKPLPPGDRPRVVTVGALVSALIALVFTVSAVVAALGSVTVSGRHPSAFPLAIFAVAVWAMAWGMWRSRYWAVLGFQMLLVLLMLSAAVGLVQVTTIPALVATLALLAGLGTLFYFMVRALARIQMPRAPGSG